MVAADYYRSGFVAGVEWCARHLDFAADKIESDTRSDVSHTDADGKTRIARNAIIKSGSPLFAKKLRDIAAAFRDESVRDESVK